MDPRALLALGILLFAGCTGTGEEFEPTTSMSSHLPPRQVFKGEVNACPPDGKDSPVQQAAKDGKFEILPGYDTIIIAWHASGEGRASAEIRWVEESNQVLWAKKDETVNSVPEGKLCGGHSHSGDGEKKAVEAGNYTTKISYGGTVAIHLEITAISSKANASEPTHSHAARP